jgi:predicted esterase
MLDRRTMLAGMTALPLATPAGAQGGLALRSVRSGGRRIEYLVRLAGSGLAPMLLCFGGGDARIGIAEYYAAVYTPESLYRDHHVILPIGPRDTLFYRFDDREARALVSALATAEPVAGRGLISGVSNGGRAAFRFAAAMPEAFRGFVTMPGALVDGAVPAAWRDYAVLLAYGTEDPGWKVETDRAFAALNGRVGALERAALAGQGHVVGADYDIDPVYARLRGLEARLGR